MSTLLVALAVLSIAATTAADTRPPIQGDERAVARMSAVLENVGGRDKWAAARTFYVKERAFLKSGETASVEIWRDFVDLTRHLKVTSPTRNYVEVIGPTSGWELRDGKVTPISAQELEAQRQGLKQEPYYTYHRLARGDPRLTVRAESTDRINVFESGKLLCWFVLDGKDNVISWGNEFKGAINQHWYGPFTQIGPISLPRWGSASDGRWRFEYLEAWFDPEALRLPGPP